MHGSDLSPYPREDIEFISSTIHEPIDEFFVLSYYRFDVYEELKRNIPYLVGIDCSTGTVSDNNAITIINPYTVKPVAEFKCPYIGETDYEKLIEALVIEYIPRAIVIIERNSVGDGIIDHLLNNSKIADRLYFDKDRDLVATKMKQAENVESMLTAKAKLKTYYGVYTSGSSRETMFNILSRHVSERKEDFITKNIIEDLTGLIRTSSGKIEAKPGGHDDSIMSYLIALYVYYHGNNLAAFGFYRTDLYDDVERNQGLRRPNLTEILPQEIIDTMERDKQIEKEMNYEQLFYDAIHKSQQESLNLHKSRVMGSSNYYDNTQKELIYEVEDEDMDLSLFDSLNGF